MKKILPIILLLAGILVIVGVYFFVVKDESKEVVVEGEGAAMIEVALADRPIVSLTPSADGYWLKLLIEKIVIDANSLDYELLYKLPDGRTQGVPGIIKLTGQEEIERELLLGSESSGKFRYDEGVEEGSLTLRFRNEKGKLVAKFSTPFRLTTNTSSLRSADGDFTYTLDEASDEYFVIMSVFGVPAVPLEETLAGPFGVFSSGDNRFPGEIILGGGPVYRWGGDSWVELLDLSSIDIGIIVGTP
ncbi:MAG: hypothetical protein ACC618_04240 [Patescibacteria group bacterium]